MSVFYLVSIILGVSLQEVLKKPYAEKNSGNGVYFFTMISSFSAMIFFIATSGGLSFNLKLLPYSFIFALSYATASVGSVCAIACGSLSLTTLVISYSLMLPTFYGLIFLKESIGKGFIIGLILLSISLILINQKSNDSKFSIKWIIFVILTFIGNGMCSVVQKIQQVKFDGNFKNEFMIFALAIVVIILAFFAVKSDRKEIKTYAKSGLHLAIICGVLNGMVNLFVMILSGLISVSIMFPLISAGGIIITYICSKFIYKEKLTKAQFIGFLIGIISIVFLNI